MYPNSEKRIKLSRKDSKGAPLGNPNRLLNNETLSRPLILERQGLTLISIKMLLIVTQPPVTPVLVPCLASL